MTYYQKYPAYQDSGEPWLRAIPQSWEVSRLGTRFHERRSKVSDKDYPPLSVTKTGILPQLDSAAKTNDGDNRKLVKSGDFVINSRSDRKGSSGVADRDGSVSLINIVMKPSGIHPTFCSYLLKGNSFIEEFYRNGHGIVADLWTTRYDEMKNIKIGIPSLPEQTAIANFLDDKTAKIDRAIAQKERLIALLKERKQILIQNAVTKGLYPSVKMKDSGIEWIGEIPEHWEVKKFKWFVRSRAGFAFPSNQFSSEGIPVIRISDLAFTGYVTLDNAPCVPQRYENLLADFGLKSGDILMAMTGGTIGKVAEFWEDRCALLNQRVCTFTPKTTTERSMFLAWTKTAYWNEYINLTAFGGAQPNISDKQVLELPVPLPKRAAEMEQIASFIKTQEQKTGEATRLQVLQIQKLREYRATLIDSAVTGKIKVPGV